MYVLHSWLTEYVPELHADPFALGDLMSSIGLCCDEVQLLGEGLDGIVVARVLELSPHPDADRIQLVQVDAGDGEPLQICCGAFNMSVGDLVPLATLGTTMPNGMEIARRKLRGQWSNGMLCSATELELGEDHSGIMILPADLTPGVPFAEAMGIRSDARYDLDLTPNRPDALSIIGVARDVAAKLGLGFEPPEPLVPTAGEDTSARVSVELVDTQLCGRFTAHVLTGVVVGSSPSDISRRLTLMGMRPVNSIVDISNYVMLEYGQPSHAFDLAKVAGGTLRVRRAKTGEVLETLDGVVRELEDGDGVIADGDDVPVSLAGVMGGASTEISEGTDEVLLELAWWDGPSIGATAKRLDLRSEASARFEKGVDPEIADRAAARFAELAVAQGATLHPGRVRVEGQLPTPAPILVRTTKLSQILSVPLERDQVAELLDPIGFRSVPEGDGDLVVTPPTWRPDSTIEADVAEEVGRMLGYERLGRRLPRSPHTGGLTVRQQSLRRLRAMLASTGISEAMPMPFLAPGDLERFGLRSDAVVVTNPLAAEESVLRTALLPGLVGAVAHNVAHRNPDVSLFEIGHCYAQPTGPDEMPQEWTELGVVLSGRDAGAAVAVVRHVAQVLHRPVPAVTPAEVPGLHPTRAAIVSVGGVDVGEVGEVDPAVADASGVDRRLGWLRIDLDALLAVDEVDRQAVPVSRFPSSDLDLALVVQSSTPTHVVEAVLRGADPLVVDVALFDVFRSPALGADRRSLAYSVRLQAQDRTLSDSDVAGARDALIAAAAAVGAELRT
jgi:phenylalanyl-tRNA synthetase beta chain